MATSVALLAGCVAGDKAVFVDAASVRDATCSVGDYREQREALNFCEVDGDCVEIDPEPCLSTYYANAATASQSLRTLERELAAHCGLTEKDGCERGWLGPPRCQRGRCVPGASKRGWERTHCASFRAQLFELDRPGVVFTESGIQPPKEAPRLGLVRVDEAATMTLQIDPGTCVPYELHADRTRPSTGYWTQSAPPSTGAQTISFEVEPGEYRLRFPGPEVSCALSVSVSLQRADGSRVPARYHGLVYDEDCE